MQAKDDIGSTLYLKAYFAINSFCGYRGRISKNKQIR
jgi:hypothetical protein